MKKDFAYPQEEWEFIENENYQTLKGGLSKREYFAAMAMQGILAADPNQLVSTEVIANHAVECATALINALNKD